MAIVVVSGLPRSGTSMMMQMLEAGGLPILSDGVREADDDNPCGYYEFEPVKQLRSNNAWLKSAEGKAVKVIYSLLYDLPSDRAYRVIFMHRDLDEVLTSQQRMLERTGARGSALAIDRLSAIFSAQLEKMDRWLSRQTHIDCLKVGYTDGVHVPAAVAARVDAFLGLDLDKSAMASAVKTDLYRQRRSEAPVAEDSAARESTDGARD